MHLDNLKYISRWIIFVPFSLFAKEVVRFLLNLLPDGALTICIDRTNNKLLIELNYLFMEVLVYFPIYFVQIFVAYLVVPKNKYAVALSYSICYSIALIIYSMAFESHISNGPIPAFWREFINLSSKIAGMFIGFYYAHKTSL